MYVEKDIFKTPSDKNVKVWRYMDFTKFIYLLDTKKMFFARPDMFNDPFEGSLTKPTSRKLDTLFNDRSANKHRSQFGEFLKSFKSIIGINCWHINQAESAAMWKLYLNSNEGIAIQSTFSRLAESFNDSELEVSLACINYVDYDKYEFRTFEGEQINFYEPFTHKRISFKHEKELRAITISPPNKEKIHHGLLVKEIHDNCQLNGGISVQIDLNKLIENVYISPLSPKWFQDLVISSIDRFEFEFNVKQSALIEEPLF